MEVWYSASMCLYSVPLVVQNGGMLGSRKGVNLPGKDVDLPAISDRDKSDLTFGVDKDVDVVFASFIRKAEDVRKIREHLGEKGKHILIFSKVGWVRGVARMESGVGLADLSIQLCLLVL